jgi:YidC/Oxa1 family membrane protein insertase
MFSFFSEFKAAQRLSAQRYHIIFFAENRFYFQYFNHLFEAFAGQPGVKVAYITADKADPVLEDKRVEAFYLKSTLAGIFPRLQADVMIMTMPDLQQFIFKKSTTVGNYVYVFHALVSTHQQYRSGAFDHYDTIFCTGPQQEAEIRESEKLYSLPAKKCIAYGYPLLEELKERCSKTTVDENKVLVAPSWYKEGILNTCIRPLVDNLCRQSSKILIRPHPEFFKRNKKLYDELVKQSQNNPLLQFDTSPSVYTHLCSAELLITDRSGIALEYAFATGRPVLFIDTPLKIQNPEVSRFSIEPIENAVRSEIGFSVSPQELGQIENVLQKIEGSVIDHRTSILAAEKAVVYPASCHQNGVDFIRSRLLS